LGDALRLVIAAVWIVSCTPVYGIVLYIIRLFSREGARIVSVLWCKHLAFMTGVRVVAHGLEKLEAAGHYIFLANHTSYYDIIAMHTSLPYKLSFIAKKSLFAIPIWGWALFLIGHIPVDRENPKAARTSMDKAVEKINKEKRSIFAFPEGTRSRSGEMADFKLGIFTLALKSGVTIVPIAIRGARTVMRKGSIFIRSGAIDVHVLDPIPVSGFSSSDKYGLAQRTKESILACLASMECK
jgi:1-acyl-sn-glycerol-3-phosphate acyltransferase